MKNVRVCPKCGSLVYFNSYFGAYICESCEWEDASYAKRRASCGKKSSVAESRIKSLLAGERQAVIRTMRSAGRS